MTPLRGLILAAPSSGSGKTIVTLALLRAMRRAGLRVAGAKAGPDYIDPGFHAVACGQPCRNLDVWAMRPSTIERVCGEIEAEAVLCEGVMGLFDGAGRGGDIGSTADLAALTGWPVVLVVDAAKQSGSVAAMVRGFATHRPDVPIAGVILNRVGSERHGGMLRAALGNAFPDLPIFGTIPNDPRFALPERHLGLVLAAEHEDLEPFLEGAATSIAASVDLAGLMAIARAGRFVAQKGEYYRPPGTRIAIARDRAFAFAYPHLLDRWHAAGSTILPFSPLCDEAPDPTADFVFLPGGYPELQGAALAGAGAFLGGLRRAAARGVSLYGECGGYMVLGEAMIDGDGRRHCMAGLLPVVTSFERPRRHLGYRQTTAQAGPWIGQRFRGHEFHYASIVEEQETPRLWAVSDADGVDLGAVGHVVGSVSGSFLHLIDEAD
jgi:cobyrinic acid a,c-diamide synthase